MTPAVSASVPHSAASSPSRNREADPGPRYDESQRQALDLSSHMVVSAAAGSGKTRVLVGRYLRILERYGHQPHQIVAITFTEEAASQMAARIREAVLARLSSASSSETKPAWEQALEALGDAPITTLHGFCLRILREHGSRIGLDPGFSVLNGGDQRLLLDRCLQELLDSWSRTRLPAFATLLGYLRYRRIEGVLTELVQRRNHLTARSSLDQTEILRRLYRRETAHFLTRSDLWGRLLRLLERVPKRLLIRNDSFARKCVRQRELFGIRPTLAEMEFMIRFQESLSLVARPSKAWKDWEHRGDLVKCWKGLKEEYGRYPLQVPPSDESGFDGDAHFEKATLALEELAGLALDRYRSEKGQDSLLDFEDLLALARSLVRLPEVRRMLRSRHRFFLVDEFQDTNRLQWEILKPLLGPDSNFFAVGDDKQSIYRFRDADVSVFRAVRKWVRKRGRVVELRRNYRSHSSLVRFSNRVFRNLMQSGLAYEAVHQEMTPVRQESAMADPGVRGLFYEKLPQGYDSEAEVAAEAAKGLLSEGFEAQEIAVLLRNRTRLQEFENAFCRWGLPFAARGGNRLHDQPEIVDLANLLGFLDDPGRDLELLGVLRSPLFSFSDEDLLLLSLQEGCGIWEKLQSAESPAEALPRHWIFARESLGDWLQVPYSSSAAILAQAIAETGYDEVMAAGGRGDLARTSIQRLLELARRFEIGHGPSRRPFLRYLEGLRRLGAHEGGFAEGGSDRIRVHTIHGAKGLQYPAVILPDLGAPLLAGMNDPFFGLRLGREKGGYCFGLSIRDPQRGYQEYRHPQYEMLRRLDRYRQTAEEKRLLYVALTRARERLVLIGRRSGRPSYARWLREADAETSMAPLTLRPLDRSRKSAGRDSGMDEPVAAVPSPIPTKDAGAAERRRRPDSTSDGWSKTTWTPTEIVSYYRCPRSFFHSRVEGRTETPDLGWRASPSALVGSAVHELLENPGALENEAEMGRFLDRWRARLDPVYSEVEIRRMRRRIGESIEGVRKSRLAERLASARRVFSEKRFHLLEQGRLVTGIVDKLFQERNGRWVVVDFKTSPLTARDGGEGIVKRSYRLQVQLYLWAVSQVLDTMNLEGHLLFTESGTLVPVSFDAGVSARCRDLIGGLPRTPGLNQFPRTRVSETCSGCGFKTGGVCPGAAGPDPD